MRRLTEELIEIVVVGAALICVWSKQYDFAIFLMLAVIFFEIKTWHRW